MLLCEVINPMKINEVMKQLRELGITNNQISFTDHGLANINGSVTIPSQFTESPVAFNRVTGSFDMSNAQSMKYSPKRVDLSVKYMGEVDSLEGVPQSIGEHLYLHKTRLWDFRGVHKSDLRKTSIGGKLFIRDDAINIVGLAMITGINTVAWMGPSPREIDISHHDVHEFQEQLIDAGLYDKARI